LAREQTFYNHLVSKYPESGPLMDFLRRALVATRDGQPALTLEHALAQYQARSKSDKSILRQMMAIRFYPAPTTFSTAETTTTLPLWMLPPPPTTAETEPETTQPSIPFPAETAPPELPLPMPPEPTVPPDTSVTCNPNGNGGFTCDQGLSRGCHWHPGAGGRLLHHEDRQRTGVHDEHVGRCYRHLDHNDHNRDHDHDSEYDHGTLPVIHPVSCTHAPVWRGRAWQLTVLQ
jgi:hypothetical protein